MNIRRIIEYPVILWLRLRIAHQKRVNRRLAERNQELQLEEIHLQQQQAALIAENNRLQNNKEVLRTWKGSRE